MGRKVNCFSKGCKNEEELREAIGLTEGKLPIKYLGIPLSVNYLKATNFSGLIDKCKSKVEGWMSSNLSFASRVELIKTGIFGTFQYLIHSFQFLDSVMKEIERFFAQFLWRGKMHAWAWEKLCKPKE